MACHNLNQCWLDNIGIHPILDLKEYNLIWIWKFENHFFEVFVKAPQANKLKYEQTAIRLMQRNDIDQYHITQIPCNWLPYDVWCGLGNVENGL